MAVPTIFSYTLIDGKGIRASSDVLVAYNGAVATVNGLMAGWTAMGTLIQNISDAKLALGSITIPVEADAGWKANPVGACDVSEAGLFAFSQAGTTYRYSTLVPAVGESVRDVGKGIDLTNLAVKAYIDALVGTFGVAGAYAAVGKYGDDLAGFRGCNVTARTHRKQALSKTWRDGSNYVP